MGRTLVPSDAAERVRVAGDERFLAVIGLGLASLFGWLAWKMFLAKLAVPTDIPGTATYVAGEWGGHVAAMAWVVVMVSAAAWLAGANLRRAIGIPVPPRKPRPLVTTLRVCGIVAILIRMTTWVALGGHGARFAGIAITVDTALMHGLALCALAGFELPAWLVRGLRCLRTRIPALAGQRVTLAELPAQGRVRVAGTIEAEALPDGIAYRRVWDTHARRLEIDGRPFQLRDGGHRVWIDLDPARAVVDAPSAPAILDWPAPPARPAGTATQTSSVGEGYWSVYNAPAGQAGTAAQGMTLSAGARVEVVGYLAGSLDGAYRGGARRIDAGRGLLYVLGGSPRWNRRMLVAGLVELAASAVLLAAPLSLLVYWAVARWHLP